MATRSPLGLPILENPARNMKARRALIELGMRDQQAAEEIWLCCARDPVFCAAYFGWIHETRQTKGMPTVIPFIPYRIQQDALWAVYDAVENREDILFEKSRDMGASWCNVFMVKWFATFREAVRCLVGSRKEEYVYKRGDVKALMQKGEWLVKNFPSFLRPEYEMTKLLFQNLSNGSIVNGEATNPNFGTGDRQLMILLDEFSKVDDARQVNTSTADVTYTRVFNSTPLGTDNEFYRVRQSGIRVFRMHWSDHPLRARGLYRSDANGKIQMLDPMYAGLTADDLEELFRPYYTWNKKPFGLIADGNIRSPWYDRECKRRPPFDIAQELDISYHGTNSAFFDHTTIQNLLKSTAQPPWLEGELSYDSSNPNSGEVRFVKRHGGRLRLWCHLNAHGGISAPVDGGIGVDVAAGTGASNSALSAGDLTTGRKIAELADSRIRPEELAAYTIALARWMNPNYPAKVIPESNGAPGGVYMTTLVDDFGYHRIWSLEHKPSKVNNTYVGKHRYGFHSDPTRKYELLNAYSADLQTEKFVNPSKPALEETLEFVFAGKTVEHVGSRDKDDPSGAGENHGDRVIADALLNRLFRETNQEKERVEAQPIEKAGTFKWLQDLYESERDELEQSYA